MSLIKGDPEKRNKFFSILNRFSGLILILAIPIGVCLFAMQPSDLFVHRTYMSENALSPGLVSSDIYSTDVAFSYNELLNNFYESQKSKEFFPEFIKDLFEKTAKIESYIQHFNSTNPIEKKTKTGKNVYAFSRSRRTDGTEGIIISTPMYISSNEETPNYAGISLLLFMADLAKTRAYWAKDLVFLVNDGFIGTKAWIDSYHDVKSSYINAENLKKRGGSIQAALNLEIEDLHIDKLNIKIEGSNGKLPNLDFFNTIIKICKTVQFKCSIDSEKSPKDYTHYSYNSERRDTGNFAENLQNTIQMVFKQATGVPSSSHGEFLNYRIEALTISSVKDSKLSENKKLFRQNVFKVTRIIEGTLRSLNNLLERFHQSFFFYILPSSNLYISIAMYMPPLGLICLPVLVKIITIWGSMFMDNSEVNNDENVKTSHNLIYLVIVSMTFGVILHSGGYKAYLFHFLLFNLKAIYQFKGSLYLANLNSALQTKDVLIIVNLALLFLMIISPFFIKNKIKSNSVIKLVSLFSLLIILGTACLLNFSLAFLISLFYAPISFLAVSDIKNKFFKSVQLSLIVLANPAVYFTILFAIYQVCFRGFKLDNLNEFYSLTSSKFFDLNIFSKTSNLWTLNFINLLLVPVWYLFWFISFPTFKTHSKVKTN